jgi:GAF domain-containing protein
VDWTVRPGEGILGAVLVSAVAEEVNDVATDPRATLAETALASLVAAPLVARGRTLGLLGAASTIPIGYQAADLKLVAAIAAIAGPALAQVRAPADDRTPAQAG